MHHEITDLQAFYHHRPLGRIVRMLLRERILDFWPAHLVQGMTIAGYGFATPLLRPYLEQARRVMTLMPGPQGGMAWPQGTPNRSLLCDEDAWPLETGSVDRLVMLHAIEAADNPDAVMAEAARVLGPGGRLLIMVPNRTGLWARSEVTPFGLGRSYTPSQLETQARGAGLIPERSSAALYIPPSDRRFWLRTAQMWENAGMRISRVLVAGVIVVEFAKQVPAPIGRGSRVSVPSPLNVLEGIARPKPAREGALRHDLPTRQRQSSAKTDTEFELNARLLKFTCSMRLREP